MRLALLHTLLTVQPFLPIPKVDCENLAFTVCQTNGFAHLENHQNVNPQWTYCARRGIFACLHPVGLEPTSPYLHDTAFTNWTVRVLKNNLAVEGIEPIYLWGMNPACNRYTSPHYWAIMTRTTCLLRSLIRKT